MSERHRSLAHDPENGRHRPTPERILRGQYKVFDAEDAGATYAQDLSPDPLARMEALGRISLRQLDAGRKFEALAHRIRGGGPGQRSCLDFSPVGHDNDSDGDPDLEADWKAVRSYLGFSAFQAVDAVCYYQDAPTRHTADGLDMLARYFKLT